MSNMMNNVKTINSAARTVIALTLLGGIGYGGYVGYDTYIKPGQQAKQALADLEDLKEQFELKEAELEKSQQHLARTQEELTAAEELNDRLETSMKLLKIDRRLANVTVNKKGTDPDGDPYMEVSFTEVDEDDNPIGVRKDYTIQGEKLYVDGWVVSFEDEYVEEADELRGASMFVFKSIYGDGEKPRDGAKLDVDTTENGIPGIYADSKKREFEQQIWKDFWRVSNDANLQRDLGIRAAYGCAPYVLGEEGKTYRVQIRNSGAMSLSPIEEP